MVPQPWSVRSQQPRKLDLRKYCKGDGKDTGRGRGRGRGRGSREGASEAGKPLTAASPLHESVCIVPLKHLEMRAAKYEVTLREEPLWATLAYHTILSRLVMFRCTTCNERMPTCHPAYRPPDELDMELFGRPKTMRPA